MLDAVHETVEVLAGALLFAFVEVPRPLQTLAEVAGQQSSSCPSNASCEP